MPNNKHQEDYEYAQWLAHVLSADMRIMGFEETAKDIRKAAVTIEKLVMELRQFDTA